MRRPSRRALSWLAFAPSLAAGVLGGALLVFRPFPYEPRLALLPSLVLGLAAGGVLLGLAALLERTSSSFRWASRTTERALARLRLSEGASAALAVSTSLGEELLFRGVLLPAFGLVPQALLFGLLHPAGRRGWSYPLFAAGAGFLLGGVVIATGRLAPAIAAHLLVNAVGLWPRGRSVNRGTGRSGRPPP